MGVRREIVAALVISAVGAGCTLFNPLDGFVDEPSTDAAAGPEAAPVPVEAGPPGDAQPTEVDAKPSRFCDAHPTATLCSDFDETDAIPAIWTRADRVGAGTVAPISTSFLSPPRGLLAHVESTPAGTATGRLAFTIPKNATRTRLSFDVMMATPLLTDGKSLSIGEILCSTTSSSLFDGAWLFWLGTQMGMKFGVRTNRGSTLTAIAAPSATTWTRYELDAVWVAGTGASVTIRVNGTVAGSTTLPNGCDSYADAEVSVGLSISANSGTAEARYDNILYDTNPP